MAQLVEIMREQESGPWRAASRASSTAAASPAGSPTTAASGRRRGRLRRRLPELQRGTTHISVVDGQGQRGLADRLDRRRLGRDRPGHRDPAEQHARRVRPGRHGRDPAAGRPLHERDGAVDRAARRAAAPRRRQRGLAAAAWRDLPDRRQRGRARPRRRRGDRRCRESTSRRVMSTSRAGNDPAELDRLESLGLRARPLAAAATSSSAARPVSSCCEDGTLAAAGDPRRGGHGVVIE